MHKQKIKVVFILLSVIALFLAFSACSDSQSLPIEGKVAFKTFSANPIAKVELKVGQNYRLTPRVSADGSYDLEIVSDNESIVRIEKGVLKAVGVGDAKVTVKASDDEHESSARITVEVKTADKQNTGAIDVFLIAGQSNAVGNSSFDVSTLDEKSLNGFPGIYYTGLTNDLSYGVSFKPWQNVKAGLGQEANYIGPELGIAQALAAAYNENTDKKAGVIKVGVNGSNLLDTPDLLTGQMQFLNRVMGNWLPPTVEAQGTPVSKNNFSGGLYRALVNQTYNSVQELYVIGYDEVNLRGMYWMQGESDRENPEEYKEAFVSFVSDLRRDLEAALDEDTSALPVLVGEISETFSDASPDSVAINNSFIAMQRGLPALVPHLSVNNSARFAINEWNAETGVGTVVGTDNNHWNQTDAIAIGKMAGEWMLSLL